MRISVYGLGYVGSVSAACLAADGHTVVGVDTNPVKVDLLNQGHAPVVEAGLGELIEEGVRAGRLRATTDCDAAVAGTDIGLVCVGTPSRGNGSLDLTNLRRVADDIGQAIRRRRSPITVVVRSTVLPGTTRDVLQPELERTAGRPVAVAVYPEFLREGTAIRDYRQPPKVVVGAIDEAVRDLVTSLAARPGAPLVQTDLELAEMAKYVDNSWHALKVTFANEIGSLAKAQGLDGHRVMDILCTDTKLNLSPVYLRPGFAFGGSCLPKDVRALRYQGRGLDLDLPLLNAILPSNAQQLDRAFQLVTDAGARQVGVLGLAFKAGTDDLRESPMVEVVERLIGKGYEVQHLRRQRQPGQAGRRQQELHPRPDPAHLRPDGVEHRRGPRPRPHPGDRQQRPGVPGGRRAPAARAADRRPRPHRRPTQRWERLRWHLLVGPAGSSSSSTTCPSRSTAGCGWRPPPWPGPATG